MLRWKNYFRGQLTTSRKNSNLILTFPAVVLSWPSLNRSIILIFVPVSWHLSVLSQLRDWKWVRLRMWGALKWGATLQDIAHSLQVWRVYCACVRVFLQCALCPYQRDDFMEVSMVMMICAHVEQVDKQVDTLILHTLVGSLLFTQLKTDSGFWAWWPQGLW